MARPLIQNPQAVPVVGVDAHLPAIDASQLTPQAIRNRFASPPSWEVEIAGDGLRQTGRSPAAAAVLVPLVMRESIRADQSQAVAGRGLHVLLTRRTAHLRDHAGQISFPGGRVEPEDEDVVATALRETEEEIGLCRSHIEVVGQLPVYTTVTAFEVTPVVALVSPGFALHLDAFEVAEAFEVPLSFLMNPSHHQRHRYVHADGHRDFLSMPWTPDLAVPQRVEAAPYFIWGATAAMLRNFYRFLAA